MRSGYFDDQAREYVILRPDTPLPWINYLGSEDYFGIISNTAGGYAFYRDARLRRITRYRYNNAPADRGARAKYVTSVCSGSLILGAAGLLRGYRATSHWAAASLLPLFGAEIEEGRVVTDRNRITGGGITAGIDFGLVLLAKLRGDNAAKMAQLLMEYDPQPPFRAGSPKGAGEAMTQQLLAMVEPVNRETRRIAEQIATGEGR